MDRFERELTGLYPYLRGFAGSLTKNPLEIDDLVQDTLVLAWRARDSFQLGTNMRAWTSIIMRNCFYSEGRKKKLRQFWSLDDPDHPVFIHAADDQEDLVELHETRAAMLELQPHMREALELVGVLGYSYEEAGLATGVPTGTIKSRVCRARTALTKELELVPVASEVLPKKVHRNPKPLEMLESMGFRFGLQKFSSNQKTEVRVYSLDPP